MKLPPPPDKDEITALLASVHAYNIPNWTSEQMMQAYDQLKSLAFEHYRTESILPDRIDCQAKENLK